MYNFKVMIDFFDGTSVDMFVEDVMNESEALMSIVEMFDRTMDDVINYNVLRID